MIVNDTRKTNTLIPFREIKEGDVFEWDKKFYIAIEIDGSQLYPSNAIDLQGQLYQFSNDELVLKVNAELKII